MENIFSHKMITKSDNELLDIINNKSKYQDVAVNAAIKELKNRNIIDLSNDIIKNNRESEIELINSEKSKFKQNSISIPKTIINASILLYISIGLGILNSIIIGLNNNFSIFSYSKSLTILLITFATLSYFTYMISKGEKWARNAFLIMFSLGILINPMAIIDFFYYNSIIGYLSSIQIGIQILAGILLLKKESNNFYRNSVNKNQNK